MGCDLTLSIQQVNFASKQIQRKYNIIVHLLTCRKTGCRMLHTKSDSFDLNHMLEVDLFQSATRLNPPDGFNVVTTEKSMGGRQP